MVTRILVPQDGSEASQRSLDEALVYARSFGATLLLLHVVVEYPILTEASIASFEQMRHLLRAQGSELLTAGAARVAAQGLKADTALREVPSPRAAEAIVKEAESGGCDLIVMGTHGRRGISRMVLGSEAETVVRLSPVPVLLVKQPG
jgi:nucleotide-binding universal stress UspA family protein